MSLRELVASYRHNLSLYAFHRLHFWILSILVFVAIETIERCILVVYAILQEPSDIWLLIGAIPPGLLEDISVGVMVGMPFLIGFVALAGLWNRGWSRPLALVIFFVSLWSFLFFEISEYFFWEEFDSRLNGIAVFYLIFPREVIGNIRESYNLAVLFPVLTVSALVIYAIVFRKPLYAALRGNHRYAASRKLAATAGILIVTAVIVQSFDLSMQSTSREAEQLAKSGIVTFVKAAITNDADYDGFYPTMPVAEAENIVHELVQQHNTESSSTCWNIPTERIVRSNKAYQPLNVVLVLEESFGMTFIDGERAYDEQGIVAPQFKRLSKEGLFFSNVFSTGNRTVRALEAIFTSFPPIPGISTSRRDGSAGMNSLPFLFRELGYHTLMLYGGRAIFDNMGTFWNGIGFEEIVDQSDIETPGFKTVWGFADEYVFSEAIRRLDQLSTQGRPVFLSILTVSNHRPYTYPAGRIARDPNEKRKENSAAYADWAFSHFISQARSHPWFKDTIFVFVGDHGPRVNGSPMVPAASYRVPLLFYSPAHIAPRRVETLGSSMDLGPTLLDLLGVTYRSPFFGRDLLLATPEEGRAVMEHDYSVAYMNGTQMATLVPSHRPRGYVYNRRTRTLQPSNDVNAVALTRAIALFQTAHKMFYNHRYHQMSTAPVHSLNLKCGASIETSLHS